MGAHLQRMRTIGVITWTNGTVQVRPCGENGHTSSPIFCIIVLILHFDLLVELSRKQLRMFTALFVEEFRNLEMKGADIFIIVM